ncbi:MAG: tandem-95 repeat protein, partial [Planctomycetes bacterium]|nr:tandem-95 repeat protein [Planctomycetota bacterium]
MLRRLVARTRFSLCGAVEDLRAWLSRARTPEPHRMLELIQLENRVLLSAVPAAVAADAVEPTPDGDCSTCQEVVEHEHSSGPTADDAGTLSVDPQAEGDPAAEEAGPLGDGAVRHELVVIDGNVPDLDRLLLDLALGDQSGRTIEFVLLDAGRDGVEQLSEILAGYSGLDALHVVTHGTEGAVQLGASSLSLENLPAYAGQIAQWSGAFTSAADVLFYGCRLAASDDGRALIEALSVLTDTDVAASLDDTGAHALGGDWELEHAAGTVETDIAFSAHLQAEWLALLAAPTASNDLYFANEDFTLNIGAPGVLGNDSDPDGDPLTAILASGAANGTVVLNANGSFSYTPNPNFNGTDSFTYQASDGGATSNVATVTIAVNAAQDLPVAVDDSYAVNEDQTLNIAAAGVLTNDSDPDGDPLTAVLENGPANGNLALNADGSFSYTPDADFTGVDSFTYKANDGTADSNVATVTITVNAVQDAPTAVDDAYAVDEDATLNIAAAGVLANDGDADGDPLSAALVSGPANGVLVLNADGSFDYTPDADFSGLDSFTYKANDGTADSNVATVTITVNPLQDAPTAADDAYAVNEDATLNIAAAGVLTNDGDADGDPLSAILVSGPANGMLVLNADGSFDYTPNADFNGVDSFTYKANDGTADSNVATVTITVNSLQDAPTAVDDAYAVNEDATLNIAAAGVLANDGDADGDPLSAVLVSGPSSGMLVLNANGSFMYTASADFSGVDSFSYKANDGTADSNVATVTITVNPVQDAPTAADDAYAVNEDATLNIAAAGVLTNDGDVDGDPLSAVLVGGPANGLLMLNSDGSFTYTPNADFNGLDSFTYKANDGTADSNVATVTITVNAVQDAPTAADDAYAVDEDAT